MCESRRARGYCLTINNWTQEDYDKLSESQKYDYLIIGKEVGEQGTPHLQAYLYKHNNVAFSTIKKIAPRAHIEIAKGTPSDNIKYCSKEGDFQEWGERPSQGKRSDIDNFAKAIASGMTEEELIDEHPNEMARFDRFYQRCKNIQLKKKAMDMDAGVEVHVIWGDAGSGKTRYVYDNHKLTDIYKLEIGDGSSGSVFWDSYDGEPIILIDDFHSNLKFDYLLRLLDRYPMKLNIKGGYTWRVAKKIYITSNIPPERWYPNISNIELRNALMRRLTTITYLGLS